MAILIVTLTVQLINSKPKRNHLMQIIKVITLIKIILTLIKITAIILTQIKIILTQTKVINKVT